MPKEHLSLRVDPETLAALTRRARMRGESRNAIVDRYIEEGARMDDHPGVVFRDGPAGRRAGLAGSGLDVWEVIETIRANDGSRAEAAAYLGVTERLVQAAIGYHASHPDEIDEWIMRNALVAEHEERLARAREGTSDG